MRLLTAVFALSLVTSAASADTLWFDPPNPTSRTPVVAHLRLNGCPVFDSSVSISGNAITIVISTMTACGVPPPLEGYPVTADLGLLPAGIYEVKIVMAGTPSYTVPTTKLPVADANPPFAIEPNVVPTTGGQVTIKSDERIDCPPLVDPCFTPIVKFGEMVTTNWTWGPPHTIVAQVPPHSPGPVDVTIEDNGGHTLGVSHGAFDFFNAAGPFDPAFFEPVLVPVIINGPGAFGAQWSTDALMRNENDYSYPVNSIFDSVFLGDPSDLPPKILPPAPHTTARAQSVAPNGTVMFVPRQTATNVWFALLAKDLSRQAEAFGTQIPVVREKRFFDRPFQILNVPADARYRVALRLYRMDAGSGVRLRILPLSSSGALVDDYVVLSPVSSGGAYTFASIGDLVARYPQLAGSGPLRIEIDANVDRPIAWGFVSVTNNETQHVTIVSPH